MTPTPTPTLTQIEAAILEGYAACHTSTEQLCFRVIATRDVKALLKGRNPTPVMLNILPNLHQNKR